MQGLVADNSGAWISDGGRLPSGKRAGVASTVTEAGSGGDDVLVWWCAGVLLDAGILNPSHTPLVCST